MMENEVKRAHAVVPPPGKREKKRFEAAKEGMRRRGPGPGMPMEKVKLTNAKGTPDCTSMTMVMYLNNYLQTSKNYGMAGAVSVVLFIVSAGLSLFVYNTLSKQYKQ